MCGDETASKRRADALHGTLTAAPIDQQQAAAAAATTKLCDIGHPQTKGPIYFNPPLSQNKESNQIKG